MNKLSEQDIAEIKEFYTGKACEIRHFARIFHVSPAWMMWVLDYGNIRERYKKQGKEYRQRHPERIRARHKKYMKTYVPSPEALEARRARGRKQARKYYQKNKAVSNANSKRYYATNREELLAKQKERYKLKKNEQR